MSEKNSFVYLQITPAMFQQALDKASMCGALQAMQLCGVPVRTMLSRSELNKKFGRGKVDRWIESGAITAHRADDNARPKYNLSEILTLFN